MVRNGVRTCSRNPIFIHPWCVDQKRRKDCQQERTLCRNSTVPFFDMTCCFIFSEVILSRQYLTSSGFFRIFSVISFKNCNLGISLKVKSHQLGPMPSVISPHPSYRYSGESRDPTSDEIPAAQDGQRPKARIDRSSISWASFQE